jgi:hypothetical protein
VFAQAEPGGINITLPTPDWTTLVPNLVGLFFDAVGQWLQKTEHAALDGIWGSGANVIGHTPLEMTWDFGPVHGQLIDVQSGARAVLLFALILLGTKTMLGGIVRSHSDAISEFVNSVLGSVILVAAFPLVIPMLIGLVNQAAAAVAGGASLSSYVSVAGSSSDPIITAILFLILAFFAIRLLIKAVWRIGFLAVLLPVGVAACALYAIPQTRWLLSWWARVWGGMLAAQIPSAFALAIGLGLFAGGGGGLGPFVYSIAFLQLATDLYSLIPFGSVGSNGPPWGALPRLAPPGTGATTARAAAAWPAGATAGHMAEMYGYQ